MLRYIIAFAVLALGATVALSFYHPPMRLMPAPAAFLDEGSNPFTVNPELNAEPEIELFYATNRLPVGPRGNRLYAVVPGLDMRAGVATVRIGEEGTTWDRIYEWSTFSGGDTRPYLHLVNLNEAAAIGGADEPLTAEAKAWFAQIDQVLQRSLDRDIIVYVHGANTTVERAAGQAAQLHHFTGRNSVVVLFVWPTAENFLRYSRDMVTAFGAAPHLAQFIKLLAENTSAQNIDVFTYSAGATVGSDALATVGRDAAAAGDDGPRLGEIYHAAPDADFRTFVDDMQHYAPVSRRMTVAVNMHDSALRLSQLVNRASRAGRPDVAELSPEATQWLLGAEHEHGLEVIQVRAENIPGLSRRSHTFWYDDPWISSDVLITLLYHLAPEARGLTAEETPGDARFWTFAPDYPERLAAVMDELRRQGKALPVAAPRLRPLGNR